MDIRDLEGAVLQAPIQGTGELAASVSDRGGIGSIQGTWAMPDIAARAVEAIRARTARPFFVNFALAFEPRAFDAVLNAGAPCVTLSWGFEPQLVKRAHHCNVPVGVQVGTVEGARSAVAGGADFIICQGVQAGGHVQSTTRLEVLLPRTVETLPDVPVIAAGGLADASDIAWARKKGATGVMMGTRFVATEESDAHPRYKQAILTASGDDTVYTVCFDGGWTQAAHRVIRNRTVSLWEDAGCPPPGRRPGENDLLATTSSGDRIRRYDFANPTVSTPVEDAGDWCLYAGEACTRITDIPSVAELMRRLSAQTTA